MRDVGRRLDGRARVGENLQRVERGHLVGEAGRRCDERRLDAREKVVFHHLAVADPGRLRDVEHLLRGDDVDRLDQPVTLWEDRLVVGDVLLLWQRQGRGYGEVRFVVERGVDRRTDQPGADEPGQDGAEKPAHRDAAMIEEGVALAVDLDRRLDAEIDHQRMAARVRA